VVESATPMGTKVPQDISALLTAWSGGDEEALRSLIPVVYPELRRIARRYLRQSAGQSLESAALANETYLRLILARGIHCESRPHFFALCAQMIRGILVDHARRHGSVKRGGDTVRVPLDEALLAASSHEVEVLALDQALEAFSKIDPRKVRVVELRYFGGLSVEETAAVLRISQETVLRDWKMAKTWLLRELSGKARGSKEPNRIE
jgi:RNA polymerase sigma-70 factor, ECF subfamily